MDKININNLFTNANAGRSGEINVRNIFDCDENQSLSTIELNIDRMLEIKEEKRQQAKVQYTKILNLCTQKINDAISIGKNEIIFEIPMYVPLINEYSYSDCMTYLIDKIKKLDMDIIKVSDLSLFISWAFIEENRKDKRR